MTNTITTTNRGFLGQIEDTTGLTYLNNRCYDGQFQRSVHGSRHDAGAVTHPDRWRYQDARNTVVVA